MADRHLKYKPGSLVLVRQLDSTGKVVSVRGGQVLATTPKEMTLLSIEMVFRNNEWHCLGEFSIVKAPPHRLPYQWDFPRLLVKNEASDIDLRARPVLEAALQLHRQEQANPEDKPKH